VKNLRRKGDEIIIHSVSFLKRYMYYVITVFVILLSGLLAFFGIKKYRSYCAVKKKNKDATDIQDEIRSLEKKALARLVDTRKYVVRGEYVDYLKEVKEILSTYCQAKQESDVYQEVNVFIGELNAHIEAIAYAASNVDETQTKILMRKIEQFFKKNIPNDDEEIELIHE